MTRVSHSPPGTPATAPAAPASDTVGRQVQAALVGETPLRVAGHGAVGCAAVRPRAFGAVCRASNWLRVGACRSRPRGCTAAPPASCWASRPHAQGIAGGVVVAREGAESWAPPGRRARAPTGRKALSVKGAGRAVPWFARLQRPRRRRFAADRHRPGRSRKPVGKRTSRPQGWSRCQPGAPKVGGGGDDIGRLPQMSRRPSPSASTA